MDAAQDLAAGGAAQAGPVLLCTLKGRGVESRSRRQIAAAGKDHAVGQLAAAAGPADAPLQGGIHQRHLLAKKPNTLNIITRAPHILNIPQRFFCNMHHFSEKSHQEIGKRIKKLKKHRICVAFIFYYGYNKLLPNIEVFWRVL